MIYVYDTESWVALYLEKAYNLESNLMFTKWTKKYIYLNNGLITKY